MDYPEINSIYLGIKIVYPEINSDYPGINLANTF
jgi:hypothetical protein